MTPDDRPVKLDEIGHWSEVKLAIVREYAAAYSTILSAQTNPSFHHVYIDAFAGAGLHISKTTGQFIPGSPLNALWVDPPFKEYHFIDIDGKKVELLLHSGLKEQRDDVNVHEGDCNSILVNEVFPQVRYDKYRRGLCLLDPYGLHLDWNVMQTAGRMRSIELFLNFPIMDMNMNVLRRDTSKADPKQLERMNAFWGDESWRAAAYTKGRHLFGHYEHKKSNRAITKAFRKRLREVAGFKYVPEPMPMRNTQGATVYYLFYASQKPVAKKIVKDIFAKYKNMGTP